MKTLAIVQVRMNSKRLPGKAMLKVNGVYIIDILLHRLSKSLLIDQIIVASSINKENDNLSLHLEKKGFEVFRGSEKNVLSRYAHLTNKYKPNKIIRITGDCPLVDPKLVDKFIKIFDKKNVDYLSNTNPHTFADGFDIEIIRAKAILKSFKDDKSILNTEHVTHYIKNSNNFKLFNVFSKLNHSEYRVTLDNNDDLKNIKTILKNFNFDLNVSHKDIFEFLIKKNSPDIKKSITLWKKAKKLIPNGNMLLSKNPDIILSNKWPAYFTKAKGCYIWDLDGNKFIDFSYMGVGTNILGYANNEIDSEVKKAINHGNISTLNSPEEVYLADKLLSMHKWADKVKFARTGGEANAIAIRIARAASKNNKVAVCGYHGWHDWYLSANLKDPNSLNQLLLKGLKTKGVPKELKDSAFTFQYNDFESLKNLVAKEKISIIKMEVMRNFYPKNNFLKNIRDLCNKKKIILIFDECTSGFRESFGGLHLKYKVSPDIATFGKALGNGYPITAILGKSKFMKFADETFISSTFWSEKLGYVAALKTLDLMKQQKTWSIITNKGVLLQNKIKNLAQLNSLEVEFKGLPSLFSFNIKSKFKRDYKQIITSEMLKHGILATNAIYLSISHNDKIINYYLSKLNSVFNLIKNFEKKKTLSKKYIFKNTKFKFARLN